MDRSTDLHAYQLGFQIGTGGMATVRYGRRVAAGGFVHAVAIKELHPHLATNPEFTSMFLDEARLAARVVHPNVVSVLDVVSEEQRVWAVMQYIEGEPLGSLSARVRKTNRPMPTRVALAITLDLLAGLDAAHRATDEHGQPLGIVHRDVSPQNVLIGVDGVARVLDFGVAKARGRLHETRDGQVKGKLAYMAPEQLGGEANVGTDVYAAAIVLWELLANRRLFDASSELALIGLALAGAKSPPSAFADVPPALDAIVMKALSLDPNARYSSAADMARALSAAYAAEIATKAEVSEWLSTIASEKLAERRRLAAEMASAPALVAPSTERLPTPSTAPVEATPSNSTLVMTRQIAPSRRRRSFWAEAIPAAVIALVLLGGGVATARSFRAPVAAGAAPPLTTSLAPTPGISAPVTQESSSDPVAAPTINAPTQATPPRASAPRPTTNKSRTPARSESAEASPAVAAPATPAAAAPAESCDPPFVVDPNGVRRYKRSCIR